MLGPNNVERFQKALTPKIPFFWHLVLIDHIELSTMMPTFLNWIMFTFASERFSKNIIHM